MSPNIKALALFTPVVASNAVFAPRRISRSVDAMEEDKHLYGIMNLDIAAGQTLKGIKAGSHLLAAENGSAADSIRKLNNNIKALESKSKLFKGASSIVDFTSRNINPIIYATGGVKVFTAEKKDEAFTEELLGIGLMRCGEEITSDTLGMPSFKYNKATKTMESIRKDGLYKNNPFLKKQVKAFKDFCETKELFKKISLKSAPPIVKGCLFVGASIGSYKLGSALGKSINNIGKENTATSNLSEQATNATASTPATANG